MLVSAMHHHESDEPVCWAAVETNVENRLVDAGGVGEGGMN